MTNLYVVATPIGNKDDISKRALDTLCNVDIIACEDSRVSKKLLDFYGIQKPLVSYHKFNEKQRSEKLIDELKQGKNIALISDAGMPCISDPGRILVKEVMEKLPDVNVICVPGASSITSFLAIVPRDREEFAFTGFLPRVESQQSKIFSQYKFIDTVFFESAKRLLATLENIKLTRGADCKIAIGRELTKIFEEIKTGTPDEIISYYNDNPLKGEIIGLIYADEKSGDDDGVDDKIKSLQALNYSAKDISQILNALYGVNKNKIYKSAIKKD